MSAVVVVYPSGGFFIDERPSFVPLNLSELQGYLDGGWLEGVATPWPGVYGYCDEEGKLKSLPANMVATRALGFAGDILCGPVVFTHTTPTSEDGEEGGEEVPLTSVQLSVVTANLIEAGGHRALVVTCPRCGGGVPSGERRAAYPGAVSRVDSSTEICSQCGTEEALIQFEGGPLATPSQWPIAPNFPRI